MPGQSHILGVPGNSNCIVTHMKAKRAVCKKLFYFVSGSLLWGWGVLFYIKKKCLTYLLKSALNLPELLITDVF